MNLNEISNKALQINIDKGFDVPGVAPDVPKRLLLIVSECTEALDAINHDRTEVDWDSFNKHLQLNYAFDAVFEREIKQRLPDELADIIIRTASLAAALGINLGEHVALKLKYNETRPHKHGKQF